MFIIAQSVLCVNHFVTRPFLKTLEALKTPCGRPLWRTPEDASVLHFSRAKNAHRLHKEALRFLEEEMAIEAGFAEEVAGNYQPRRNRAAAEILGFDENA
jgi:hypothetical protein